MDVDRLIFFDVSRKKPTSISETPLGKKSEEVRKREGWGNVDGGNNDILEDVMAPKCSDVCKFLLTLDEKRRRNCRRCRQRGHVVFFLVVVVVGISHLYCTCSNVF